MPPTLPTDAELRILQVLWERGPSSVHDVHGALQHARVGYTTVLKTMQVMHTKKLVARQRLASNTRAHVYTARVGREQVERSLVGDFAERAFQGSLPRLVVQALSATGTSPEEITRIRALLDRLESER